MDNFFKIYFFGDLMKKFRLLSIIILVQMLGVSVFAHEKDPVLGDNPTEEQIQLVRDGAINFCTNVDDDNEREMCVMDYYAQHNLEEEPSCD